MTKRKIWIRRLGCIGLAGIMFLGCSACGKASKRLEDAKKNLQEAASLHYSITSGTEMTSNGESQGVLTYTSGDCIADPLTLKVETEMDLGKLGRSKILVYINRENDAYNAFATVDEGTTWYKQDVDEDNLARYDVRRSLGLYLDSVRNFKIYGKEILKEREVIRYDGSISGEAIEAVLRASGALSHLQILGLGAESLDLSKMELGKIPVTVWIENETSLPVKFDMDLTEPIQAVTAAAMEEMRDLTSADIQIASMNLTMSLDEYNSVEDFVIPEAVLAGGSEG